MSKAIEITRTLRKMTRYIQIFYLYIATHLMLSSFYFLLRQHSKVYFPRFLRFLKTSEINSSVAQNFSEQPNLFIFKRKLLHFTYYFYIVLKISINFCTWFISETILTYEMCQHKKKKIFVLLWGHQLMSICKTLVNFIMTYVMISI